LIQEPSPFDDDLMDEAPEAQAEGALEGSLLSVTLRAEEAGQRLDRVLAGHPDLEAAAISRARLQALILEGALTYQGRTLASASEKAKAGTYHLILPAPRLAQPQPEDLELIVLFEDAHLIVVDKPAGMAAHPAPGTPSGTLVNALLHHCAGSLSGIGGVARPGIVHRLDKDTSGVMVAAKSDAAHAGLSALFAAHDIDRVYTALVRGVPEPQAGLIVTQIGRSLTDRKKMAVLKSGGREAITRYRVEQSFGPEAKPHAARITCRLETGRTHQIRVHMAHKGTPCLADGVYGGGPPTQIVRDAILEAGLTRQALHASILGFIHPITGERLSFETPLPPDMATLAALLAVP
jgi:23S rRNA pseudouridine1911/1915/1917 synthase